VLSVVVVFLSIEFSCWYLGFALCFVVDANGSVDMEAI
jgi:hypothetical protein